MYERLRPAAAKSSLSHHVYNSERNRIAYTNAKQCKHQDYIPNERSQLC